MRHGCGDALSNFSKRSQKSSGSTFISINSCINVLTFRSTDFGSLLDNSNRFARNFRHFSLVLSLAGFYKIRIRPLILSYSYSNITNDNVRILIYTCTVVVWAVGVVFVVTCVVPAVGTVATVVDVV